MEIFSIEEIISKSIPSSHLSGVYFLIKDDEIVYVGQSKNIFSRIDTHKRNRKLIFDRVFYIYTPELDDLDRIELESKYISDILPRYNIAHAKEFIPKPKYGVWNRRFGSCKTEKVKTPFKVEIYRKVYRSHGKWIPPPADLSKYNK